MKKFSFSLLIGTIIGGLIAFLVLDYENSSYEILNYYGEKSKIVKEWDFKFISNASSIIFFISIFIFIAWTFIEKKRENEEF